MTTTSLSYPPDPDQHLSSNGVGLPVKLEPTETRETGVGDDPIYGINGENTA
jgi:hypothetical protein